MMLWRAPGAISLPEGVRFSCGPQGLSRGQLASRRRLSGGRAADLSEPCGGEPPFPGVGAG